MDIPKKVLRVVVGSREGGRNSLAGRVGASTLGDGEERLAPFIGLAAGAGREGSDQGVHGAVREAGVEGVGTVPAFTPGPSLLQPCSQGAQARLPRCRAVAAAIPGWGVDLELGPGARAAGLAHPDPEEEPLGAAPGAALQPRGGICWEEMRIKLSWVLRDLLGASGRRILHALAKGETDPKKLAARGEDRLKCTREQLVDALTGNPQATHLEMLARYLDQWEWVDQQMGKLSGLIAEALKPQPEAVARRAEVPGFGPHWAPPVIGEVGVRARTFPRPGTRPLG